MSCDLLQHYHHLHESLENLYNKTMKTSNVVNFEKRLVTMKLPMTAREHYRTRSHWQYCLIVLLRSNCAWYCTRSNQDIMYSSRVRGCRCLPKAMGVPAKMKMTEWTLCMLYDILYYFVQWCNTIGINRCGKEVVG